MRSILTTICFGFFVLVAFYIESTSVFQSIAWASDNNQEEPTVKPNRSTKKPAVKRKANSKKKAKKPASKRAKKPAKRKLDKYEIAKEKFRKHIHKDQLGYYFSSKRRMRNLFQTMYEEETKQKNKTLLGLVILSQAAVGDDKKTKRLVKRAKDLREGYRTFKAHKTKKITFKQYKNRMIRIFGFYP